VGEHRNPRRLITARAQAFALFDAAFREARARSFSKWAVRVLERAATEELERAGVPWSHAQGRPLDLKRKGDRNVWELSGGATTRSKRISAPAARAEGPIHLLDRGIRDVAGHQRVACGVRSWEFDSSRRRDVTCKNCIHAAGIGRRR
jgi:hypothetical protein